MEFRLAKIDDLSNLQKICLDVVKNMHNNNIMLWNEWYPFEEFENDIKKQQLFVLEDNNEIVAFFAVLDCVEEDESIVWAEKDAKAKYLSRLGVNVNFLRQGIAKKVIEETKKIAKKEGATFLRLMVADFNIPAVNLYKKMGFKQAGGKNCEIIKDGVKLLELPFEVRL